MAESESQLEAHVVSTVGSTEPRVKSTQILSADFIQKMWDSISRRASRVLTPWLGPTGVRRFGPASTELGITGQLFQSNISLDTTTTAGTVSVVVGDQLQWHGVNKTRLTGFHAKREDGTVDQAPVAFDFVIANEDVTEVPVADTSGATIYEVFLACSTIPKTVTANPRTNTPEYTEEETILGVVIQPDQVTDLGGGSVELRFPATGVDMPYICSDSMAGREATAYLAAGPESAITATAIETATITNSGGRNLLVIGDLGQGSVSTTPSDYRMVVRGLGVSDYLWDPSAATGFFLDASGYVLLGTIHDTTPDTNETLSIQALTFGVLRSVVSMVVGRDLSALTLEHPKLLIEMAATEDALDKYQIAISTPSANAKWSGAQSWSINEEGEQAHVTTKQDLLYVPDDSGTGVVQRTFTKIYTPMTCGTAYLDPASGGVDADWKRGDGSWVLTDSEGPSWWNPNANADTIEIVFPLSGLSNVEITGCTIYGGSAAGDDVLKVEIGYLTATTDAFTSLKTFDASAMSGGPGTVVLSAPGDFTALSLDEKSNTGTANDDWIYVVKVTIANGTGAPAAKDAWFSAVKFTGTVKKNWPIAIG